MAGPNAASTIAAIATPPGPGGIGIIRLSGPASLTILTKIFAAQNPHRSFASHQLAYGWITDPDSGRIVDEVLAVFMAAPHTYTREDVVEIHCHGSFLILQEVLNLCLSSGARLAAPGEFTKTAFLNGRIDLSQAEAVLALLQAKTREGLTLAITQLQGDLYQEIIKVRDQLIAIKAIIEVAIDFPDDDVEIIKPSEIKTQLLTNILPILENLISAANNGRIMREGIAVVIIGRPNVGKSSLLNALLREERAIVTPIPGTTRDTIEEYLNIKGMPVKIIDTAGIREGAEAVEEFGIQRTKEKLAAADLALLLLDSSDAIQNEDYQLLASSEKKPLILVANKSDISRPGALAAYQQTFPGRKIVPLSAKTGAGIEILENTIFETITGHSPGWDPGHGATPNIRHQAALGRALQACQQMATGLDDNLAPELLAIDAQSALDQLGEIVGYTTTEDILDKIFGEFCIGK